MAWHTRQLRERQAWLSHLPHAHKSQALAPSLCRASHSAHASPGPAATLIAHEVGDRELERLLASPRAAEELGSCDVAAFAFDSTSPESFRGAHLAMMRVAEASGNALPCVFLAAKDDLAMPRVRSARAVLVPAWPHQQWPCWFEHHLRQASCCATL